MPSQEELVWRRVVTRSIKRHIYIPSMQPACLDVDSDSMSCYTIQSDEKEARRGKSDDRHGRFGRVDCGAGYTSNEDTCDEFVRLLEEDTVYESTAKETFVLCYSCLIKRQGYR